MIIVPSPLRTRLPSRHTGSYDELALVIGVPVSAALVFSAPVHRSSVS